MLDRSGEHLEKILPGSRLQQVEDGNNDLLLYTLTLIVNDVTSYGQSYKVYLIGYNSISLYILSDLGTVYKK